MPSLARFWRSLETVPGLAGVASEWKSLLGPEYDLVKGFLRPNGRLAEAITCPSKRPCDCCHAVIQHAPDDIVAVCQCDPERCDTVPLSKSDIVIYEVNVMALGEAIARAFQIKPEVRSIDDLYMTWCIGIHPFDLVQPLLVFLTFQLEPDQYQVVCDHLLARNETPFVILTPTSNFLNQANETISLSRKFCALALEEVIVLENEGKLASGISAELMLSRFSISFLSGHEQRAPFLSSSKSQRYNIYMENIATGIMASITLRDLIRIRYFYPDATQEDEARRLHEDLVLHIEASLDNEESDKLREIYRRPEFEDLKADASVEFLYSILLAKHPDIKIAGRTKEEMEQDIIATIQSCKERASPSVIEIMDRIAEIIFFDCRIPSPKDDPAFEDRRRFLQMLREYWELTKIFIQGILESYVYFQPNPLLEHIVNLRERVKICFSRLSDLDGAIGAQEAFENLLDTALGGEPDDLQAVPEWTHELISNVERFLGEARIQLKTKSFPLTDAEQLYISRMRAELSQQRKELSDRGKRLFASIEKNTSNLDQRAKSFLPQSSSVLLWDQSGLPESLRNLAKALDPDKKIATFELSQRLSREPSRIISDHRSGKWKEWIDSFIGHERGFWWLKSPGS